jgi:hypothetical protein
MGRDELVEFVLITVQARQEAVRSRPHPPRWHWWEVNAQEADLELGELYSPSWFGAIASTEAGRLRMLRLIHKMAERGQVTITRSEGGRLQRVKLTAKGSRQATTLRKAGAAVKA